MQPNFLPVVLLGMVGSLAAQETGDEAFWKSVYSDNHVLDLRIKLTGEAWDAMQPARRAGAERGRPRSPAQEFSYVKADIVVDGTPLGQIGLRFKGNSSYRSSAGSMKRPLKIDTNRFKKKQKLHGRTKINLSNAFLDSAFMKEKLGYELYRAAGLATPGVGWANVTMTIDGIVTDEPLGIYVVIEQVDDRFLERQFGKPTTGSLVMKPESLDDWRYLGDQPQAYKAYNIKLGKSNTDQILRFAELLKLINDAPDHEFEKQIGDRMDLDQLAAYLAATSILANIDSYVGMPHNYYLLLDKADGKLRMLPWDVNEAFGTFNLGRDPETIARWNIDRPWIGRRRLLERLFLTQAFPKLYKAAMAKLMAQHFTERKLFTRIDLFQQTLKPFADLDPLGPGLDGLRMGIDGDDSGVNRAVNRRVSALKPFITQRIQSVKAQLAGHSSGRTINGRRR